MPCSVGLTEGGANHKGVGLTEVSSWTFLDVLGLVIVSSLVPKIC